MALYKRGEIWWVDIVHDGIRIQKSTQTPNKKLAHKFHDKIKSDLWLNKNLHQKVKKTWQEAVVRWFSEMKHKRSLIDDKWHVNWLDKYFGEFYLEDITKDVLEEIANIREDDGRVKPASVNRMLAFIRSVLRKAANEWEWIDQAPYVRLRKENNKRIRWITREEAQRLQNLLPKHLSAMATFSLATGLRQSNVLNLKWRDINMNRRHAIIHADEAKGKKDIAVPLNEDALSVLEMQLGLHPVYVFTYRGNKIKTASTKAWRKALKESGIENFRWHDLRHTWASWHVQNGTSLQELQMLGGWASLEMVLRYAHLSSKHLITAAERINTRNT